MDFWRAKHGCLARIGTPETQVALRYRLMAKLKGSLSTRTIETELLEHLDELTRRHQVPAQMELSGMERTDPRQTLLYQLATGLLSDEEMTWLEQVLK